VFRGTQSQMSLLTPRGQGGLGRWSDLEAHSDLPEVQELIRSEIARGRIRVMPAGDGRIRIVPVPGQPTSARSIPATPARMGGPNALQRRLQTRRIEEHSHAMPS
jgi:hypothetical protein